MTAGLLYLAIGAGITSALLTGCVRRYAVRMLLDVPNARSSHSEPTPRGGGIAIALTFAASLLLLGVMGLMVSRLIVVLLTSGGLVAAIGFLDDRYSLPAVQRFAVQLAAAAFFVFALPRENGLTEVGLEFSWLSATLIILLLVWSTNLFNFMDGIDGIAGSEAAFAAGAGACLNFLHRGDSG